MHVCSGPVSSVYIAAMDRIVKYSLNGLHESIVQSKDVNGAIDIAVDYENDVVSTAIGRVGVVYAFIDHEVTDKVFYWYTENVYTSLHVNSA